MDPTSSSADHTPLYDLPPESFWLSTADEQDWFDRYAVMQRKTSLKLGGRANNNHNHKKSSFVPHHRSSDANNRKSSSLLGLANSKPRKSFGPDRNPPPSDKKPLFRSRSEPNKPPGAPVSDPGSPRVSCTGRIGVRTRSRSGDSIGKKAGGLSKLLGSLFGSRAAKK